MTVLYIESRCGGWSFPGSRFPRGVFEMTAGMRYDVGEMTITKFHLQYRWASRLLTPIRSMGLSCSVLDSAGIRCLGSILLDGGQSPTAST